MSAAALAIWWTNGSPRHEFERLLGQLAWLRWRSVSKPRFGGVCFFTLITPCYEARTSALITKWNVWHWEPGPTARFLLACLYDKGGGGDTVTRGMRGFSLIELMIVVAIIAILASFAIPAYRAYVARAADTACLGEAKAYATHVAAALAEDRSPDDHVEGRCELIPTPASTATSFTASPVRPGTGTVTCDLAHGGTCSL